MVVPQPVVKDHLVVPQVLVVKEVVTPDPENHPPSLLVTSVSEPNKVIFKGSSLSVVQLRMLEFP
jgi:hypothetical protein